MLRTQTLKKSLSALSTTAPMMRTYVSSVEEHYHKNHTQVNMLGAPKAPYTDTTLIEKLPGTITHRKAVTILDKVAYAFMQVMRQIVHLVFRDRYAHHAVVLETVAAVPGMVAGMLRHFTSLRRMHRDYGWISSLIEEAENERMHLLVWMQFTSPTFFERIIVLIAQVAFTPFYTLLYLFSPVTAHRVVGYLEEEAVNQYTEFLKAIDDGRINGKVAAPEIAKKYWNLAPDATLRDVVLCVRADESFHRDINHHFGDSYNKTIE